VLQEVLQGSRDEKAFAKLEDHMALWHAEVEAPEDSRIETLSAVT